MTCAGFHYEYAGLAIVSDISIPDLADFVVAAVSRDVVRFVAAPAGDVAPVGWSFPGANHVTMYAPGVGRYDIVDGSRVTVSPAAGARPDEVRLFLMGSAWAALCHQRGLIPFHASVVAIGDRAVAFCGPSGSGKSSIAAWLVGHGNALVSDDLAILLGDPEQPVALWPSTPRLRLWSDAIDELSWSRDGLEKDFVRTEKYVRRLAMAVDRSPVPLAAIYLLEWGEPGIERLTGVTALRALIAASGYRTELLRTPAQIGDYWRRMTDVTRRVPVWRLSRPRDWDRLPDSLEPILRNLSSNRSKTFR